MIADTISDKKHDQIATELFITGRNSQYQKMVY